MLVPVDIDGTNDRGSISGSALELLFHRAGKGYRRGFIEESSERWPIERYSALVFGILSTLASQLVSLLVLNGAHRVESHQPSEQEVASSHERACPVTQEDAHEQGLANGSVDGRQIVGDSRGSNLLSETLSEVEEVIRSIVPKRDEGPGQARKEETVESRAEGSSREIPDDREDHGLPEAHHERESDRRPSDIEESLHPWAQIARESLLEPESGLKGMLQSEESHEKHVVKQRVVVLPTPDRPPVVEFVVHGVREQVGEGRKLHGEVAREEDGL